LMTARADALLAWLRDYAERHVNSRLIDERRCLPPNIVLDFGNRGLFGLEAPERYGGLALSERDALRVYMQLGAIDVSLGTMVFLHNTNGILPILHHATAATREELMPGLAQGRELAAFALSEPEAGSNLAGLRARAVSDGEGWTLHGVKRWNGSAWAGTMSVFVRDTDARGRLRGLTGFAVRQSAPGVKLGPESLTMGIRGIVQNSVEFAGVRVTREQVLGEPGQGMKVIGDVLAHGRLGAAAVAIGAAQRAAQLIYRYASRREIETGLLLDNPWLAQKFSELLHRIAADEELLLHFAERHDTGAAPVPELSMAVKVSATDTANFAADLLVQLLGGRGYMETNLAPQMFRDVRMLSIGEGANESLLAALGRDVRLGAAMDTFLRQYAPESGLADRLAAVSVHAWHDALRGRLAVAALNAAAARATGDEAASLFAGEVFERLCAEAERGAPSALLSSEVIRMRCEELKTRIGDTEPLAPGVDLELDPLLRRER
ncbi:MAG: acyl-CoA dehydrogenase family protein, partial [Acidobacteriota bacterium]